MTDIKLSITLNADQLNEKLVILENIGAALKPVWGIIGKVLYEVTRHYPPPPPNSTYIRTYRLFNSWQLGVSAVDSGQVIIIESNGVHYAPYVQARATQAGIHAGRWQTVEDVVESQEGYVETESVNFLAGLLR